MQVASITEREISMSPILEGVTQYQAEWRLRVRWGSRVREEQRSQQVGAKEGTRD